MCVLRSLRKLHDSVELLLAEKRREKNYLLMKKVFPASRFAQIVYFVTKVNGALWKLKMSSEIEFFSTT